MSSASISASPLCCATVAAAPAAWAGAPTAVEISRSGDGAHVWTFFWEPVAAADARAMGAALLYEAMAIRGEMDIASYDRFFPAQDYLPRRGFGKLITFPLEGRCRQNRTTLFVDPAQRWRPVSGALRLARSPAFPRVGGS